MFKSLSLFSFWYILISCAKSEITFQGVEVQCQTIYGTFNIFIDSNRNIPVDWPDQIFRVSVVNGAIPTIYPNAFTNFENLKILQIRQCELEDLKAGAFSNLRALEILRLNGNKLRVLKNGVFGNLNIIFLNLDHNLIENIASDAFADLPKLRVLDLSNNKLRKFDPNWIKGKPQLSSVFLTYNELKDLPESALKNYRNDIDFSNNRITNISNRIFGLDGKKILGQLFLNDNHIEVWDENFLQGVEIRVLDLSRNKLECIDGKFEHYFVAYQTRLDGNPWNCKCLLKIGKWLVEHKVKVKMRNSIKNCNLTQEFIQFS